MIRHYQYTISNGERSDTYECYFDLVVPYGKEYDPERIVKDIKEEIKNEW